MVDADSGSARGWIILAGALLLAAAIIYSATRYAYAEHLIASTVPRDWERAAQLEPADADYWDRLGRYRQLDFADNDLPRAIADYRRATQLDPLQADYWLDLGSAYENVGQPGEARQAFLKARADYPLSAEVAWRYGNFLLRQGQLQEALAEIHRAVAGDHSLVTLAASRTWHATGDIQLVLNQVLPPTKEAYLAAMDAFVSEGEPRPALAVWQRLLQLGQHVDLERANVLVDALTAEGQVAEAVQVWHQALIASGASPPGTAIFPLISNGGFERDSSNGGFDWRISPVEGVHYDFDSTVAHSGSRSLRITFDGQSNVDFRDIFQIVPVEPHTRYRFSVYFRTEGLTTESGLRVCIFHVGGPGAPDAYTPDVTGTQPWTLLEVEFTTGPQTAVVEIHLCRLPSEKFDNKIRGTAWVDDVTLLPADSAGKAP